MSGIFHVDFYSKDWLLKTQRLTLEERGAFIQIVAAIYEHQGPIDNDPQWLSNLCNCSARKIKSIISALISKEFIFESGGKISQKRAEKELENARKRRENAAKNGRKSAENKPETNKNNNIGSTSHQLPVTSNHSISDEIEEKTSIPAAVEKYNDLADRIGLARCQKLTEIRKNQLRARLSECGGLGGWEAALEKLSASEFCRGENDRGWKADFDFLISQSKFTKLMEGGYDSRKNKHSDRIRNELQDWVDGR